jgi:MFS family permease
MHWLNPDEDWKFAPHERPVLLGAPATPSHPPSRRIAYVFIAILVGITGGLGNALVSVNLVQLQGALGLDLYEINWLPTAYVMTFVTSNILLVKCRYHYGIRWFACVFLILYALITFAHLFVHTFATAVAVRAASGMTAAALNPLAIYYLMQAVPAPWRGGALVFGLGIPLFASPLARLFSSELLSYGEWTALYIFEFGLTLLTISAVFAFPLPPSERKKSFEPLDFLSFSLFAGGVALLCAVLGEGRFYWWTDTPWIGWALCASIPMITVMLLIEHHRRNPLIMTRWLGTTDIVRFIVVSILVKIALSEQSGAAVGLLNALGYNNDQFHLLFSVITISIIAGSLVSAILINVNRLTHLLMLTVALVAVGAALDSYATNLMRPQQFYVSQALVAFSTTFFMGPAFLYGLSRVLQIGGEYFLSFIAIFGITQNVGNLMGSALLSTFQVIREKAHSHDIIQHMVMTDPLISLRFQKSSSVYGPIIADPNLRSADGAALLSQQVTREANVLAYNDVCQLIAALATAISLYFAVLIVYRKWRGWRAKEVPSK